MRAHEHPLFDDPRRAYGPPLSAAVVEAAEQALGRSLPQALLAALADCNGGALRRTALVGPDRRPTLRLRDLCGLGHRGGVEDSAQQAKEWGYPSDCLLLHAEGPTAVLMDYRRCGAHGEPSVIFVDTDHEVAGRPLERTVATSVGALLGALRFISPRTLIALPGLDDEDALLEALQAAGCEGPVRRDHEGGRSLSRVGWDSVEPGAARVRLVPNLRFDRTRPFPELPEVRWLLESTAAASDTPAVEALAAAICPGAVRLYAQAEG